MTEDYLIFDLRGWEPNLLPDEIVRNHETIIAQILRSELDPLSSWEVSDALTSRIAFGLHDASIIDWHTKRHLLAP